MHLALLRQDNPNWEAYFIVTDDQPFDAELITIINGYNDVRLQYLPLESKFRQKVTEYTHICDSTKTYLDY